MRRIFIFGIILSLLFVSPSYLDAGLNKRDYDMIKVAFMNGCFRMLKITEDEEKLKLIKASTGAMMELILTETDKYMEEIEGLNK